MTRKINNSGFTLVEMLVVITIIALMGLMIIPAILGMFSSGSDSQSYAMLTTELSAARTLAIKTSCYVCVHIQQADQVSDANIPASINGKFYMAILVRNPFAYTTSSSGTDASFYQDQVFAIGSLTSGTTASVLMANIPVNNTWVANQWSGYWVRMLSGNASGQTAQIVAGNLANNGLQLSGSLAVTPNSGDYYMIYKPTNVEPQTLPGTIAFGRLCAPFVNGANFQASALGDNATDTNNNKMAQSFMTVNIIFSPAGTLVTTTPDFNGCAYLASQIPGTTISLPGYFYDAYSDPTSSGYHNANGVQTKIWPMPVSGNQVNVYDAVNLPQPGTSAVTIVDYMKYSRLTGNTGFTPNRQTYLQNDNGGCPYLAINTNIGQMLPRK